MGKTELQEIEKRMERMDKEMAEIRNRLERSPLRSFMPPEEKEEKSAPFTNYKPPELNKIGEARRIMREAFAVDPDFKMTYITNIMTILYEELDGNGYRDDIGEKILDLIFSGDEKGTEEDPVEEEGPATAEEEDCADCTDLVKTLGEIHAFVGGVDSGISSAVKADIRGRCRRAIERVEIDPDPPIRVLSKETA